MVQTERETIKIRLIATDLRVIIHQNPADDTEASSLLWINQSVLERQCSGRFLTPYDGENLQLLWTYVAEK
jgi:hypothetical protein